MPDKTEKKPSKEDLLLERLDRMEGQLQTLVKAQQGMAELKADIAPLMNSTVRLLIDELGVVESGFQLEDVFTLVKQGHAQPAQIHPGHGDDGERSSSFGTAWSP